MNGPRRIGSLAAGLAAGAVLVSLVSSAAATTLLRMSLPELIETSERVVHARVLEQRAHWDDTGTRIFTDTVFEVLDEAKGQGPDRITIRLLGGQVGGIDLHVPGTPTFAPGEETVLFTYPRPDGTKHLVGLSQGVMRIVTDAGTGERVAVSEIHGGVSYLEVGGGRARSVRPAPQQVRLSVLMDHVRAVSRGEARRAPLFKMQPSRPRTEPIDRRPR